MLPAVRKFEFSDWKITEMMIRPSSTGRTPVCPLRRRTTTRAEVLADRVGGQLFDRAGLRGRFDGILVLVEVPRTFPWWARLGSGHRVPHPRRPSAPPFTRSGVRSVRPDVM